jgi:hypothetical protein
MLDGKHYYAHKMISSDIIFSFHSGAQPITTAPTSVLSKDVLDAALKEWEEDLETETEGEDGEHSE